MKLLLLFGLALCLLDTIKIESKHLVTLVDESNVKNETSVNLTSMQNNSTAVSDESFDKDTQARSARQSRFGGRKIYLLYCLDFNLKSICVE